jgi:hypothetical protein
LIAISWYAFDSRKIEFVFYLNFAPVQVSFLHRQLEKPRSNLTKTTIIGIQGWNKLRYFQFNILPIAMRVGLRTWVIPSLDPWYGMFSQDESPSTKAIVWAYSLYNE